MKQIAPNYTYNKTTGVITLTGVNIDRDQLLLIVNTTRNVTYYNFADSATTLQAFTQGANTLLTLNSSVITASSAHANGDALIIYYDDQASISGTVTANIFGQDEIGNPVNFQIGIGGGDNVANAIPIGFNDNINNFSIVSSNSPLPITGTVTIHANVATYVGRDSFTSTTAATIASANENRKALTIFSEGPGLLYVCAGSSCTTTSYQVRLSAGEYWECPTGQLALIHTAIYGSTGTARIVSVN